MQVSILSTISAAIEPGKPDLLQEVLLYILLPMGAMIIGSVSATFFTLGPRVRSGVQHLAAGVVFYAVAVELLPKMLEEKSPVAIVCGFTIGVVLMLVVKWYTERNSEGEGESEGEDKKEVKGTLPTSLIFVVALDVSTDGLLVGLGFAAGAKEGILLTLALAIEILFLAMASSSTLGRAGVSRVKSIAIHCGLALLIGIGGVLGVTVLGGLSGALLEAFLAFGVAALLYLITEELLMEAHKEGETPLATGMFFAGFLLFLIIGQVA
ncbi:MAG: transporter [Chloroflexota bacterium]